MLKYSIRLREPKQYTEIELLDGENLYLSPDVSFISGVTSVDTCIVDGQKLLIEIDQNEVFNEVIVEAKNVTRQGYVIYDKIYELEEYKNNDIVYKCFRYIDGKYYFTIDDTATSITVNGKSYQIDNNTITVETKYWVENNEVTIENHTYNVDLVMLKVSKNNGTDYEYIANDNNYVTLKDGTNLKIKNCDKKYWKKVTKFTLRKNNDIPIKIDYLTCIDKKYYFEYGTDKGNLLHNYFDYDYNDKVQQVITYDNKMFKLEYNDAEKRLIAINKNNNSEKYYNIKYDWVNIDKSKYLGIYADNTAYEFVTGQHILVSSNTEWPTRCEEIKKNEKSYFKYCGKMYEEVTDINKVFLFIVIDGVEYKIHKYKNEPNYGYFYFKNGNKPLLVIMNDNFTKGYIESQFKRTNKNEPNDSFGKGKELHDIIKYSYVLINGQKFIVKKYNNVNNDEIKYINVTLIEKHYLTIMEIISNNLLICRPDIEEDDDMESVCQSIIGNYHRFNFYIFNEMFPKYNISKDSFFDEIFNGNPRSIIGIFNFTTLLNIPLLVSNEYENNLNQADIVQHYFSEKEIAKRINPYVDMEREVYYPTYYDNKTEDFTLINDIEFNLHFRSRNKEDWKINDDVYGDTLTNQEKIERKIKCDWNFFDYYKTTDGNDDRIIADDTKYSEYHQPADLLSFLNFTNDDIFYQKSKVGKSFLRLSFFNSPDPLTNSLLYSCTVFVDEGKLFKRYLDCTSRRNSDYASVFGLKDSNGDLLVTKQIDVSFDTYDKDNEKVTFDEDKRLSASFTVNNRYEAHESAEGFYLYIFKEYCEGLHEEPIYMKVDFNHAGEGRTINLTVPFKITKNEDGTEEYNLLNLKDNTDDIEYFKKGIPLNELYKHVYIELQSVYDIRTRRYCYYLPEWLTNYYTDDNKKMKFNLYEIKIKDESNPTNNETH